MDLQSYLPLPRGARYHDDLGNMTAGQIEQVVRSAYERNRRWPAPRLHPPMRPRPSKLGETILLFEIMADRWLLCVYAEGTIALWDTQPSHGTVAWRGLVKLSEDLSWSSAAAASGDDLSITLVVTKTGGYAFSSTPAFHTLKDGSGHRSPV
jgi:hypothetical protein